MGRPIETIHSTQRLIFALIGAWAKNGKVFYVKRSMNMPNYPGVFGLLSTRYDPLNDGFMGDAESAKPTFQRMADERLHGAPIKVGKKITSHTYQTGPAGPLHLEIFEIFLEQEPALNPEFYTEFAWMDRWNLLNLSIKGECGKCTESLLGEREYWNGMETGKPVLFGHQRRRGGFPLL